MAPSAPWSNCLRAPLLRPAQSGMAMVRARADGTGTRFHLGEMTLTRCAVSLENGVVGIAYVQGRSLRHAEQAAVAGCAAAAA